MQGKFLDERSSIRVWTNYLPREVKKYFAVRKLRKIGCTNETCTHFSHDPSAPLYELTPIWPVVAYSNRLSEQTKETLFFSPKEGEYILALEENLEGRFWDKVFILVPGGE